MRDQGREVASRDCIQVNIRKCTGLVPLGAYMIRKDLTWRNVSSLTEVASRRCEAQSNTSRKASPSAVFWRHIYTRECQPDIHRDMLPAMNVYESWTAVPGIQGEALDNVTLTVTFEAMAAQVIHRRHLPNHITGQSGCRIFTLPIRCRAHLVRDLAPLRCAIAPCRRRAGLAMLAMSEMGGAAWEFPGRSARLSRKTTPCEMRAGTCPLAVARTRNSCGKEVWP